MHRDDFFHRVGNDGLIGFGESYMAGDWDADDLGDALRPLCARIDSLVPPWMQRLRRFYVRRQPPHEDNSRAGARDNIHRHYDLSNELFALFLDESMTYSCARYEPGDTLERAQERKIDRILDAVRVEPGTPTARDRHRLGRPRRPCRATGRDRDLAHDLTRAAVPWPGRVPRRPA